MERFLAYRDGRVTGRVAAVIDRSYNSFHKEATGFFGFLEMENDPETTRSLLDAARQWLRRQGATAILGPFNPSTNYECGMLVDGFDTPPMLMMPHNPRYYPVLVEAAGWRKAKDLYAYLTPISTAAMDKAKRVARRSLKSGDLVIRPIRMKQFWEDVEKIWSVYNSAWERNWGYAPMSRDEFLVMAKEMKPILEPEMVLLGEVKGQLAGFALTLPDINAALRHAKGNLLPFGFVKILYHKRFIRSVRVLALGVIPQYRTVGVAAGFYARLFEVVLRLGYKDCEFSWVLEDNTLMNRSIAAMGAARYKTYRIYEGN